MYGYDSKEETALYILKNFHTIAVVGCSRTVGKPSHDVPQYLQSCLLYTSPSPRD